MVSFVKDFFKGLVLSGFVCSSLMAADYTVSKGSGNKVEFSAVGNPGFLRINGKGAHAEGKLSEAGGVLSGELFVALDAFDTGMGLRNDHMKDKYLETKKFPKASFKLAPYKISETSSDFSGDLTLKEVTKKISGKMSVKGKVLVAKFTVSLVDFPVGVPEWKGVTMAKEVDISVEFPLGS